MANREQVRRVIIRVVTSLLNLIIGPAGAWMALGINGIAAYISVHTMTRWIVAEAASTNESFSRGGYRISPLLLLFAGIIPQVWGYWGSYVVVVPFLLGSFEGAYWSAFHGFRKSSSTDGERKSVKTFQRYEVASTVIAALLIIWLKYQDLVSYGGILASLFALVALLMPMDEKAGQNSIALSTIQVWSENAIRGRIVSGSLGVISYLSLWSMRIVSLETGGIALLGGMVAASKLIGYIISEFNESRGNPDDADLANWRTGNHLALSGIVAMAISLALSLEEVFLFAYLLCTCGTSGILHPLEVRFAGEFLSGEGGNIGLRERVKFATQAKVLMGYILFLIPIIVYLRKVPSTPEMLIPALIFASMCCVLNLHPRTIDVMRIHRFS
ncbi:MAG: hypothetical protein VXZ75_04635 [Candidatus Thermoplasmatota archaeon]|nr:hypothetical protein [Candidatus Thermoplasmatota archaeon]